MSDSIQDQWATWQANQAKPSDEELATQIRTIEALLLENQRTGYEIHSHLTRYPEDASSLRPILDGLAKEQIALTSKLGEILLEWRRRGGNFDLRKRGEPRIQARPQPKTDERKDDEEDEDEEEEPSVPVVSAEALRAWKEQIQRKQAAPPSRPAEPSEGRQRSTLLSLMNSIGEIRELNSMVNIIDEVDGLEQATSAEMRAQWPLMSKHMQRAWLAMLVARTRAVKDATTTQPALRERIKTFILHFPAYAKTYQPGYVNGLQVSHNPEGPSWRDDALHFWAQLKLMTVPPPAPPSTSLDDEHDAPSSVVASSASASASAPVASAAVPPSTVVSVAPSSDDESEPEIEPQWPLWSLVRDKRGILLGGEPREPARARLESVFAMAELEWISGDNPRRLDSVVERVAQNKVDIVWVLQQWTAHKVTNKLIDACKASGVPWALVGSYSVKSVRAGLERFMGSPREATG